MKSFLLFTLLLIYNFCVIKAQVKEYHDNCPLLGANTDYWHFDTSVQASSRNGWGTATDINRPHDPLKLQLIIPSIPDMVVGDQVICKNIFPIPILNAKEYLNKYSLDVDQVFGFTADWVLRLEVNPNDSTDLWTVFEKYTGPMNAHTNLGVDLEYYGFTTKVKDSNNDLLVVDGEAVCDNLWNLQNSGSANGADYNRHTDEHSFPTGFTAIASEWQNLNLVFPSWQVWPSQQNLQNVVFPESFIPKIGSGAYFKTRYEVQCGTTRINPNLIKMNFCLSDGSSSPYFSNIPNRYMVVLQLPEVCNDFIYISKYVDDEVIENKVTNPWRTGAILSQLNPTDRTIRLTVQSQKETNYFGRIPDSEHPSSCESIELFYDHGSDNTDERTFHTVNDLIFRNADGDLIYETTCQTTCTPDSINPTLCTHTYDIYVGWIFDRIDMQENGDVKTGQLDMRIKTKSSDGSLVLAGDARAQIVVNVDSTTENSFGNKFYYQTIVTDAYTYISHERPLIDALFTDEVYCQVYGESQSQPTSSADTVEQHGEVTVNLIVEITYNDDDWVIYRSGEMQFGTMYLIDGQITRDRTGYVEGQVMLSVISDVPDVANQKVTLHYQSSECVPETFDDHNNKEGNVCKLGYLTYTDVSTYNVEVNHDTLYTIDSHYLPVKMLSSPKETFMVIPSHKNNLEESIKICKLFDAEIATEIQAYDHIWNGGWQGGLSAWTLNSDETTHIFTVGDPNVTPLDVADLNQKCQQQAPTTAITKNHYSDECVEFVWQLTCGNTDYQWGSGTAWFNGVTTGGGDPMTLGRLSYYLSTQDKCTGTPQHHTKTTKTLRSADIDETNVLCYGVKPRESFCNTRPGVRLVDDVNSVLATAGGVNNGDIVSLEVCESACRNNVYCKSFVHEENGGCLFYTQTISETQSFNTGTWTSGTCVHEDMFIEIDHDNSYVTVQAMDGNNAVWSKYTNNVTPIVRLDRTIQNAKIDSLLKHDCNQERYVFANYLQTSKHIMEVGTHLEDCVYSNEFGFSYKCFAYGWEHMCNEDVPTKGDVGLLSSEEYNVVLDGKVISTLSSSLETFFGEIYMSSSCTSYKDNEKWLISVKRSADTAEGNRVVAADGSEGSGVSIFTQNVEDIQQFESESYTQACKRKCAELKDITVANQKCNGFVWDSSAAKCILLHTVIDGGVNNARFVYQPRTDDHIVPSTAVASLVTDFHHIPLVLDFKHRTLPAGVIEIQLHSIDLSENEELDSITNLEERIQAGMISNQGSRTILSTNEFRVKHDAQKDHPFFYMCIDHLPEILSLYSPHDLARRTAICNIDLTGYIGDTSIFDTGDINFGQGLIYEDRVFIAKKLFDGLVNARTIGIGIRVKHKVKPESVANTFQGGRRLANRKLADENTIVFTDGVLKVENGVYTLLEVTTESGTKETIIVGASFLEEAFDGKTTVFWLFFWIAIGVNGAVILTLVVKSFMTLASGGKAEKAWTTVDSIKNGLWVIGHLGVFTIWTISAAATGGTTTLGFFVFLVSALIFGIATVSWVNAKIKSKGNIEFSILGDKDGEIWKLNE